MRAFILLIFRTIDNNHPKRRFNGITFHTRVQWACQLLCKYVYKLIILFSHWSENALKLLTMANRVPQAFQFRPLVNASICVFKDRRDFSTEFIDA